MKAFMGAPFRRRSPPWRFTSPHLPTITTSTVASVSAVFGDPRSMTVSESSMRFGSSSVDGLNWTGLMNAHGQGLDAAKWGAGRGNANEPGGGDSTRSPGVPRKARSAMGKIQILHESRRIFLAGRNRCNGFGCNQYLLASRDTNEALFIDASDDWADDWVAFCNEAGLRVRGIFFTHLHVDNIIGLPPLWTMLHRDPAQRRIRGGGGSTRAAAGGDDGAAITNTFFESAPESFGSGGVMHSVGENGKIERLSASTALGVATDEEHRSWDDPKYTGDGGPARRSSGSGGKRGSNASSVLTHIEQEEEAMRTGVGASHGHNAVSPVLLAWNPSDAYWAENFGKSCLRYGRTDMASVRLPFSEPNDPCHIRLTCNSTRSTSFLQLGQTMLFYIHAPGHSMGHTMLHIPEEKLLFTGDLLCYDSVGRVDLPMALGSLQAQSLRRLEELPDNTVVLPGHGRMSTLARERRCNTGLQRVYELMAAGRPVPSVGLNNTGWM